MGSSQTATVAEHIQELRSRLIWTVLFLVAGAVLGYFIHDTLIAFLQRPLNDSLYYTTPGGAFSFIIKVCTVFGLVVALPMLIYQTFAYFGPLIRTKTKTTFISYVIVSCLLAVGGMAFAYYISLPAALHFLVNFGNSSDIKSLITANEYFNFVLTYIAGFAVLFQVPLIVLLIDTIKPMPPSNLLKGLRYVVLISFIIAAVLTPTPDPMNQALMAGPIIVLYIFSVLLVAIKAALRKKPAAAAPAQIEPVQSKAVLPEQRPVFSPRADVKQTQLVTDIVRQNTLPRPATASAPKHRTVTRQEINPRPTQLQLVNRRVISDFVGT